MLSRRDALRFAVLSALAAPLATACEGSGSADAGAVDETGLVASKLQRSPGRPDAIPEVVAGLHALAGSLYGGLATQPGNVVLSPYSLALTLGMTLAGAGGGTADEVREVLGVTSDSRLHGGLGALSAYVESLAGRHVRGDGSRAELALDGASQLYGQAGVDWQRDFLDLLARAYGAGLRTVDFERDPAGATEQINTWVADRTQGAIPELIPAGVLDQMTRLVLVNALHLRAPWEFPFTKSLTGPKPFHRADGSTTQVDSMAHPMLASRVTQGDGWQAARLLYAGGDLAMTVILPDPGRAEETDAFLASGGVADVVAEGRPVVLDLQVPRWTFRTAARLDDVLRELGMRSAFDPQRADFTPMTEDDLDLHVSAVLQDGFVAVDEEGTEAAAATAAVMSVTGAPVTEPFHVDRPFSFVIHDVEYGTPLFLGRVADPGS